MTARRTHCPQGRVLYRTSDLPEHLATKTMLARDRRRLAEGQEPVATYWTSMDYVPLYERAGSVALPPLSPARQAAWVKARTCARCAAAGETPWPKRGARRLCGGCRKAEELAVVRPSHNVLRLAATSWAEEFLGTPDAAVLVAVVKDGWNQGLRLAAITVAGEVLLELNVASRSVSFGLAEPAEGEVAAAEVLRQLEQFAGRHFVHHIVTSDGRGFPYWRSPVGELLELTGRPFSHTGEEALRQLARTERERWSGTSAGADELGTDVFQTRHTHWRSISHTYQPRRWADGLADAELVTAPTVHQLAAAVIAGVREIAADDHPDGPACCPVLPPTGLDPCGSTDLTASGACREHTEGPIETGAKQ